MNQTQLNTCTNDDQNIKVTLKMNPIYVYEDSLSNIKRIVSNFEGTTFDLSKDEIDRLSKNILSRGVLLENNINAECELGYEDALIPLVGISPDDSPASVVINELYKNYFSLVGGDTPSKSLSKNIYQMISSKYMNHAIRNINRNQSEEVYDSMKAVQSKIEQGNAVEWGNRFGFISHEMEKKISRSYAGIARLNCSESFYVEAPLPLNKTGLWAAKAYFENSRYSSVRNLGVTIDPTIF